MALSFTTLSNAWTFETPNAFMRTYASPTVNGADLAVWRTEMAAGASGPLHAIDVEQVVVVLSGRLRVVVAGEERVLEAGDGAVLPAHVERQLSTRSMKPCRLSARPDPGRWRSLGPARRSPSPGPVDR